MIREDWEAIRNAEDGPRMEAGSAERLIILATLSDPCDMWRAWMESAWRELDVCCDLGVIERQEPPFFRATDGQTDAMCPFCGEVVERAKRN